jgi:hypothetical protein
MQRWLCKTCKLAFATLLLKLAKALEGFFQQVLKWFGVNMLPE